MNAGTIINSSSRLAVYAKWKKFARKTCPIKKLISTSVVGLFVFFVHAQDPYLLFIDSLANKTSQYTTILLFAEWRDTVDKSTGRTSTQRNSYYYDWVHKELRFIDVYEFDQVLRRRTAERIFKKKKRLPPATHIVYTFLGNSLAKVKLTPPPGECERCAQEYYFANEMLVFQNKKSNSEEQRNFVDLANFYLSRLQLAKKTSTLKYWGQCSVHL